MRRHECSGIRVLPVGHPWIEVVIKPVPSRATAPGQMRILNRSRTPPRELIGGMVVLCSHGPVESREIDAINRDYAYGWTELHMIPSNLLVAAATVVGPVSRFSQEAWHLGEEFGERGFTDCGWRIDDVFVLPEPIRFEHTFDCSMWELSHDLWGKVQDQMAGSASCVALSP